jgi:hypothetical protein
MKLLFICFLFVFCPPHHYQPHRPVAAQQSPFCKGVVAAFAKSKSDNKEKFVMAFPADQQDKARTCLE